MALKVWQGRALAVAQISTVTIGGTPASGNTVWVEINRRRVTYTVPATPTVNSVAAGLYALIQALATGGTAPEFAEITWTDPAGSSAVITATSATAGQPFTMTVGQTGGGASITLATPTAATGPNHADNAANWDSNSVPTTGDDVTVPAGTPDILYGLDALNDQMGTVRLLGGRIGLPDRSGTSPDDPGSYFQYRTKRFALESATAVYVGDGTTAPEFLRLEITGSTATPIRVMNGEGTADADAIQISAAAGTSHSVTVNGNRVALAPSSGEVIELSSLRVGTQGPDDSFGANDIDPVVRIGSGVTIAAARLYGGTVTSDGTFTAITVIDGEWNQDGGTPGTVSITDSAGTYRYTGNASHGAVTARGEGAVVDFTGDSRAFSLANSSVTEGAAIYNPQRANCTALTIDKESVAVSELGNSLSVALTAA